MIRCQNEPSLSGDPVAQAFCIDTVTSRCFWIKKAASTDPIEIPVSLLNMEPAKPPNPTVYFHYRWWQHLHRQPGAQAFFMGKTNPRSISAILFWMVGIVDQRFSSLHPNVGFELPSETKTSLPVTVAVLYSQSKVSGTGFRMRVAKLDGIDHFQ